MVRALSAFAFALLVSSQCFAQQSLVGTYRLVVNDIRIDGQPVAAMGKSQHGYLVITPKVLVTYFTADERKRGTSVEAKAALLDSLTAYAGSYRVQDNKLMIDIDTAWNE